MFAMSRLTNRHFFSLLGLKENGSSLSTPPGHASVRSTSHDHLGQTLGAVLAADGRTLSRSAMQLPAGRNLHLLAWPNFRSRP